MMDEIYTSGLDLDYWIAFGKNTGITEILMISV